MTGPLTGHPATGRLSLQHAGNAVEVAIDDVTVTSGTTAWTQTAAWVDVLPGAFGGSTFDNVEVRVLS